MSHTQRLLKLVLVILYGLAFVKDFDYGFLSIVAICIHEIFHIVFLKLNSINFKKFKVSIFGFRIDLSYKTIVNKQITMYSIGSLANLFIGIVFILVRNVGKIYIFDKFILVNFIIGIFNLIPIFPLDGAFILKSILFRIFRQYTAMLISILVSLSLLLVLLLSMVTLLVSSFVFNITHLIVIIFSMTSTYREYKTLMSTSIISRIENFKYVFLKKGYVSSNVISVHYDLYILDILKLYRFNKFTVIYFVDDNLEIVGIMNHYNVLQCYKIFGNIQIRDYYKNK